MTISISTIKEKLAWRNLQAFAVSVLRKGTNWFVLLLLLFVFFYGGYLWYFHVYHSQWDEGRKQAYMQNKDKGTVFNRNRFNMVVSEMEGRKSSYATDPNNLTDIFKLQEITVKQ